MQSSCLIICGEKSGEEHAQVFVPKIFESVPNLKLFGVGGDWLKAQGAELLYHLNDFSSMGFSEVLGKIPFYFHAMNRILSEVQKRNCRVAILVDFQDFNLRLAVRLKSLGVKVLYYVAPQAWAWREGRAKKLADSVSDLFCLLPFEKEWFASRGVKNIHYVGHPLARQYKRASVKKLPDAHDEQLNLILLAGSRNLELRSLLPVYGETLQRLKTKFNIVVSTVVASSVNPALFEPLKKYIDKFYTDSEMETALEKNHFALCTSGTASLICAQKGVPAVVCYSTSMFNEFIFNSFIKYQGPISLTNIIAGELLYPELIQEHATAFNIVDEFERAVESKSIQDSIVAGITRVQDILQATDINPGVLMAQRIGDSYAK